MQFSALAIDYDGTLAWNSTVTESTCAALRQWKASGRRLLLVTGRELHDLFGIFGHPELFDRIVAENGGVLYNPQSSQTESLGPAPPETFICRLREQGVHPLSVGHVIVASQETYHGIVQAAIEEFRAKLQIISNKGALMVLPRGIDKASGLRAALRDLDLHPSQVVGVGDAENDEAFLSLCGFPVAVANALPAVKKKAALVTQHGRGEGVEELIDQVLRGVCKFAVQKSFHFAD